MIFATIGTQLPFDRLIIALDQLAGDLPVPVVAQIGETSYEPTNMEWHRFIPATQVDQYFQSADVIVAHAGIGTIISGLAYRKPVVIFPRKADLGEHRNDHQQATADRFEGRSGLYVARTTEELGGALRSSLEPPKADAVAATARSQLLSHIKSILQS